LFAERATDRRPRFALGPANAGAVAEICRRLDGLPLAIELAAARVGVLSVEQIAERLSNSLRLLTSGSRTAVARQRTLEGTLDWSHELLSEEEQLAFRRLSVFSSGCTLEAASAVGFADDLEEEDVLDLLSSLVDKSLVVVEASRDEVLRYRMLEPVRQYASQRLEAKEDAGSVRGRHAAFFVALAEEAEPELTGPGQEGWLERLEAEHDNLRAALSWSLEVEPQTTLQLALALARFWEIRSYYSEGSAWLEAALRKNESADASMQAKALTEAGTFAWRRGDYEQAIAFHREALTLYRELGDEHGVAFALMCLGSQEVEKGDLDRAFPLYEEALSISRRIGDKRTSAFTLANLGQVERHRGNHSRAIALNIEALSLFRDLEDTLRVVEILSVTGRDTAYHGAYEAAEEFIEEGLPLARDLRNGYCVSHCLEGLAALAGTKADGVRAARLWGAAEALREAVGAPLAPVDLPSHERNVAAVRAHIDETSWEAAWAEGKAMTLEEAVEYALSEEEPTSSAPLVPEPLSTIEQANLTRREREVAALVSRGLTNRQIASELVIGERTVETHVANILKKLRLHSREQISARVGAQ
jgi:non-specific serine/threonine protein kinase